MRMKTNGMASPRGFEGGVKRGGKEALFLILILFSALCGACSFVSPGQLCSSFTSTLLIV